MFINFAEAETYLTNRKSFGIKPGLERIKEMLHLLDHPERKVKGIHVAGTNGKGSTVQYMKNALTQNNYNVGVFVSPSADSLTGHMFINDHSIEEIEFVNLLNDVYPIISELDDKNKHPTEFEIITVLAFLYFADSVDIALIEAGMGGRGDTTNCFSPLISIITNVSLDHMMFLGNNLEDIAYQKAGIIKNNIPSVIGPMAEEALKVIQHESEMKSSSLLRYGQEFKIINSWDNGFIVESQVHKSANILLQMKGEHQKINASIAYMAILLLREIGFSIDLVSAVEGFKQTRFSGRFECIHQQPQIIIDGAHNEAGIKAFIQTANLLNNNHKKHIIFAAFKDKDIKKMLSELESHFETITLTTFENPRAASKELLSKYENLKNIEIIADWKKVIESVLMSQKTDTDYFVTGSLDFITIVKKFIDSKGNL
ncbi:bifunctional folylpolyglutamate synthase/dihydrofolate synthase [Virgibacillus flavescens]|uniref:bifunctional folylpolyglutamate synthase/dihydrofolate synthase n=1 Tax=Virgibacillus flavescens TaxID=1611422 RepID=UPI003D33D010